MPASPSRESVCEGHKVKPQKAQPTRPAKEIKACTIKGKEAGKSSVGNGVPVVIEEKPHSGG